MKVIRLGRQWAVLNENFDYGQSIWYYFNSEVEAEAFVKQFSQEDSSQLSFKGVL